MPSKKTKPICYELVLFEYDWYEFGKTLAVSFDVAALEKYHEANKRLSTRAPLVKKSARFRKAQAKDDHCTIRPVEFVESITKSQA